MAVMEKDADSAESRPRRRLTSGELAAGLAWCSLHRGLLPAAMFRSASKSDVARGKRLQGACRSCSSFKRLGKPLLGGDALDDHNRQLLDASSLRQERKLRGELGFRARPGMTGQLDISTECAKIGAEPGHVRKPLPVCITPEAVVAARQERFTAPRPPTETRQQRRACERRVTKDATSASKRYLTDAEAVLRAIDRSIAARSRATGGAAAIKRVRKRVRWDLPPHVVGEIMRRQGYRCALTGRPFAASAGHGSQDPYQPSPNRINPGGDYVPENCEFVLWWVNRTIGDMPRPSAINLLVELKLLRKDFGQAVLL